MNLKKLFVSLLLAMCLSFTAVVSFAETDKAVPADTGKKDGRYTVNLTLNGGEVNAAVSEPVFLRVTDGKGYASIVWENVSYDKMIVDGETFLPTVETAENGEETLTFEIPVTAFDQVVKVTALNGEDETEYGMTFSSSGIHKVRTIKDYLIVVVAMFAIFLIAVLVSVKKLKQPTSEIPKVLQKESDGEAPEEASEE